MTENTSRTVGEELQAARLDKGLSLDDIQATTKIQKRYLAAIENGQFDQLPGAFYERAFTRQYAAAVGVDADELIKKHEGDVAPALAATEPVPDMSNARVDADNITRTGMHRAEESAIEKTRGLIPKIIAVIAIIAVIGLIWALVSTFASNAKNNATFASSEVVTTTSKVASSKKNSAAKSETTKSGTSKKTASAKSASAKNTTTIGTPTISGTTSTIAITTNTAKAHTLVLTAAGDVWSQVTIDGSQVYYQTLPGSTSKEIEVPANAQSISLHFGNADNVTVQFDGKDVTMNNTSLVWTATLNLTDN